MFDGPYNTVFTAQDAAVGFTCPRCKRRIGKGEKVIAFPLPRGEVWHAECYRSHLLDIAYDK